MLKHELTSLNIEMSGSQCRLWALHSPSHSPPLLSSRSSSSLKCVHSNVCISILHLIACVYKDASKMVSSVENKGIVLGGGRNH